MPESVFSNLPDDVVLYILHKLESDPREWPRIACVSTRFSSLIRTVCFKSKCLKSIPAVASVDDDWSSLYKISACCPGLIRAGVLRTHHKTTLSVLCSSALEITADSETKLKHQANVSEFRETDFAISRKRGEFLRSLRPHVARLGCHLSREAGNKLLASRFKDDRMYICDWPGCIHIIEKKHVYIVFRGWFVYFKHSRVWRAINYENWRKIDLNCAYCASKQVWDLGLSFCCRRYHDDGEPHLRGYVCENGHVSGAMSDLRILLL